YLGEAQKAIEYYEKALGIDLKVFGDKHRNVARDCNNLGSSYSTLGEAQMAMEYFEKALIILSEVYGDDHPKTKFVKKNLQMIKDKKGNE
ncbi:MAG: tetratricopeptide repeat protein, partial [bacterium]